MAIRRNDKGDTMISIPRPGALVRAVVGAVKDTIAPVRTWLRPDINDESIWTGSEYWGEGVPGRPYTDPELQVSAYRSWPYICIDYNARSVARQTLRLYTMAGESVPNVKGWRSVDPVRMRELYKNPGLDKWLSKATEIEEITDHPLLATFRQVSPMHNQADLWMLTETYMGLTGNCYWWPRRNTFGEPFQIWFLESQSVRVILGKTIDNYIVAYLYRTGSRELPFPPEDVVHHKYPNPFTPAIGFSPIQALTDSVQVNEEMYIYERAQFRNMARPDGVLEIPAEQPLSDAEYDRLKAEWRRTYGSSRRSGKTAILEGGVTYKAISMSPRDLGHIEGRKLTREEIADGYGVPMPLLSPSGSNKAVSKTAYDQYMRDTIGPKLKLYEQKINEQLLPMFEGGENLFVAFDNPVPEDRDFALKKRDADLKSGYTSINIEREAAGEEVVDWGDVPILPANMIPLGSATPAQVQAAGQEPKEIDYERLSSEIAETILERADEG